MNDEETSAQTCKNPREFATAIGDDAFNNWFLARLSPPNASNRSYTRPAHEEFTKKLQQHSWIIDEFGKKCESSKWRKWENCESFSVWILKND